MKVKRTEDGFIVVLETGDEVIASLKKLAEMERIAAASLTGIGAVRDAVLGYIDTDQKQYIKREFAEPMEMISLTGNLSRLDGENFAHCHTVLADKEMRTVGGRLFQATASVTVEIFLRVYEGEITRRYDPNMGVNLIKL